MHRSQGAEQGDVRLAGLVGAQDLRRDEGGDEDDRRHGHPVEADAHHIRTESHVPEGRSELLHGADDGMGPSGDGLGRGSVALLYEGDGEGEGEHERHAGNEGHGLKAAGEEEQPAGKERGEERGEQIARDRAENLEAAHEGGDANPLVVVGGDLREK